MKLMRRKGDEPQRKGAATALILPLCLVVSVGCTGRADDGRLEPGAPPSVALGVRRVGSALEWGLPGGARARAEVVREDALRLVARRPSGEEFGLVLHEDGFEEWATDAWGRRDGLRCRVEGPRERYEYEGAVFHLEAADLSRYPSFGQALRSRVRARRPYEESLLVDNILGTQLMASLEEVAADPLLADAQARLVIGEDGRCRGEFIQLLGLCVRLKCMYGGGPTNAVCNGCTGALVGCAIIAIAIGLGLG